jgi:hypothetical protein
MPLQWIAALSGLVTSISAAIAVWRYFFFAKIPLNLSVANTIYGETSQNGQQTGMTVSYNFSLTNYDKNDVQIDSFALERKFFGFLWRKTARYPIQSNPLPFRLAPACQTNIEITIDRIRLGMYRLIVREYGSRRLAKFLLSELRR